MATSLTLAFDVETIESLAAPKEVFEDARSWSTYVGVVSNRLGYEVVNYLREHGVYNEDFFSRADKARSLAHVRSNVETDRYVFVGPGEQSAVLEEVDGWEYLSVAEAARKADWELAKVGETTSPSTN